MRAYTLARVFVGKNAFSSVLSKTDKKIIARFRCDIWRLRFNEYI